MATWCFTTGSRKRGCQSFSLENDSIAHKAQYGWDAKAPLGGVGTLDYFNRTLKRMAKMAVIEIPVKDVVRTCARCTYYGEN